MKRELFTAYPHIKNDEPMLESNFNTWMEHQAKRSIDSFVPTLKRYLGQYGFDINVHKISEEQVKAHRFTFDYRQWRANRNLNTF